MELGVATVPPWLASREFLVDSFAFAPFFLFDSSFSSVLGIYQKLSKSRELSPVLLSISSAGWAVGGADFLWKMETTWRV